MISIYQARKILGKDGRILTDSQVEELLRECLVLADLFMELQEATIHGREVNKKNAKSMCSASGAICSAGKSSKTNRTKQDCQRKRVKFAPVLGIKKPSAI
ncbi:MAG: hypothetical protein M1484_03045 [Patescibacteria group bacterium]|nr:hypothetical protein [Patescibacteria group bacterium]MCL5432049.1 hypothetical protein [Patescibacteria group bacterium]